ncbi:MAG: L-histidine N(alpha)-methyltransferase [Acidimicrobiales bacterium]
MTTTTTRPGLRIDVHVLEGDERAVLGAEVRAGLGASPKWLSPKWLYDDVGCALFERITTLAEYYPTRRERAILVAHDVEIARCSGADTLVELGSGSSDKTRLLLDALADTGQLRRFVPFEISVPTLATSASAISAAYPGVEVHAVAGDFERHLDRLPTGGRRLVAFLGGTIGNLAPALRADFLGRLAAVLAPGDALLLGTDLVKDPDRLRAAYDDSDGVTAAFNRNLLRRLNRELGANFDPDRFTHVAFWDPEQEWMEMRLRAEGAQSVRLTALDLAVGFDDGEELRTEISAKFRCRGLESELSAAGFEMIRWWTDPAVDFAVSLSVPA